MRLKTIACALLFTAFGASAQNLKRAVKSVPVDETKLHGTWYEVARYPFKPERGCASDATELIARADKPRTLRWVDACRTKDGNMQSRNLLAKPDKHGEGKFTVTRFFILKRHYWVVAVDPDYKWSLIGSPDHKSLWIFSRTPELTPEAYDAITATAAAEGFPKGNLVHTKQTPLPYTLQTSTPPNMVSPGATPANPDKK